MKQTLYEVCQAALLWHIWVRLGIQDVRLRFRRSVIGMGWISLQLAITILAIGLIYGNLLGQDLNEFIPYLTVGLVLWGYLTNSIVEGGQAFLIAEGYIKQIDLPIYVYIFRSFVSISLTAFLNGLACAVVVVAYRVPVRWGTLWAIPGIALWMLVVWLLIAVLAYLNARFRDAAHLAAMGMQVMFYVTPILYPADMLRQRHLGLIIDFNPAYHLLEIVRRPLLVGQPADSLSYVWSGLAILLLVIAAMRVIHYYGRRIVFAL